VESVLAVITTPLPLTVDTGLMNSTVLSIIVGTPYGRRLVVLLALTVCVGKLIESLKPDTPLVMVNQSTVVVSNPSVTLTRSPFQLSIVTIGTSVLKDKPRPLLLMVVTSTVPTTVGSVWV
jgi:hypothetical protein